MLALVSVVSIFRILTLGFLFLLRRMGTARRLLLWGGQRHWLPRRNASNVALRSLGSSGRTDRHKKVNRKGAMKNKR